MWCWDSVIFCIFGLCGGECVGNDCLCVLLVDGGGDWLLFMGDIIWWVEVIVVVVILVG